MSALRPATVAGLFVVGVTTLRLLYAWPLEALPDEADNWVWSAALDYGYYDQPPLLMWLLALATWVSGSATVAIRVVPALVSALLAYYVFRWGADLVGERLALQWLVLLNLTPVFFAGAMLATPDTPMVLALVAASWHFHRALREGALQDWGMAGLWCGLALLAKFVAVLVGISFALVLLQPRHRHWLARPGPCVAAAVAFLLFSPVVVWNAQHDWVAFGFQWEHGFGTSRFPQWKRPAEYVASQALVVGPIPFALVLTALVTTRRRWEAATDTERVLWYLTAVPLLFFLCSSLFQKVEANWPCFAYVPGLLLLLDAFNQRWARTGWLRTVWHTGWVLNAAALVVLLVHIHVPLVSLERDRVDDFFGWRALGREAERLSAEHPHLKPAANTYQVASELRFYSSLPVVSLNIESRPNQYDLWYDRQTFSGDRFLLFHLRPIDSSNIRRGLEDWRLIETLSFRARRGREVRRVYVYEIKVAG